MRLVEPEGTRFFYVLATENALELTELPLSASPPDTRTVILGHGTDTRLAVFASMLPGNPGRFYVLYWPDGTDLVALDQRVAAGTSEDADFAGAVRTVYQETLCGSCGSTWPTLVIPPGDPYPGAPGLLDRKIAAAQLQTCPRCGASLRQLVVKILDWPAPSPANGDR